MQDAEKALVYEHARLTAALPTTAAAPAWATAIIDGIATLSSRMDAMSGRMDTMSGRMDSLANVQMINAAVSFNSSATAGTHLLRPVPSVNFALPGPELVFPATKHDLCFTLTHAQHNALLAFYGLPPITGNSVAAMEQKVSTLARHIGVRL